jgi:hypothetical protein
LLGTSRHHGWQTRARRRSWSGYAAIDLAEIVGPKGEVVALERSQNFVRAIQTTCRARSLANVRIHELDLMKDKLPKGDYDFAWCRWVVSFVNDQSLLIGKTWRRYAKRQHRYFHEYGHYETWRFFPRLPMQERFREHVIATWRESGGEPDGALTYLTAWENGFGFAPQRPHIFCLRSSDYMWQWPVTFIETYLERLVEMGRIDHKFAEQGPHRSRECREKSECPDAHTAGARNQSRKNCSPGSARTLRRGPVALHRLSARR